MKNDLAEWKEKEESKEVGSKKREMGSNEISTGEYDTFLEFPSWKSRAKQELLRQQRCSSRIILANNKRCCWIPNVVFR